MNQHRQTFRKKERLVSQKLIEELFGRSRSMAAFPLRTVYIIKECACEEAPLQVLISVPKRHFHHAVDRNRVKRQIREAYRLHKTLLYDALPEGRRLLLAFVWLSDRHLSTAEVQQRVVSLLQRIAERVATRTDCDAPEE